MFIFTGEGQQDLATVKKCSCVQLLSVLKTKPALMQIYVTMKLVRANLQSVICKDVVSFIHSFLYCLLRLMPKVQMPIS